MLEKVTASALIIDASRPGPTKESRCYFFSKPDGRGQSKEKRSLKMYFIGNLFENKKRILKRTNFSDTV